LIIGWTAHEHDRVWRIAVVVRPDLTVTDRQKVDTLPQGSEFGRLEEGDNPAPVPGKPRLPVQSRYENSAELHLTESLAGVRNQ
jgi:hypothetical protein